MSEKPLAERLQVKHGRRLAVVGASPEIERLIGATATRTPLANAEVVLVIAADRDAVASLLPATISQARSTAIIWLAYPKLSSSLASDLSRDVIRSLVARYGFDTVSQIAIDEDWSALRLKRI